jgi:ribosomal protein S18 acetylase RimI-like enzyme
MADVHVRPATRDDAAAIVSLGSVVVPATYAPLSPAYAEWCLERWWSAGSVEGALATIPHWVAEQDGEVVGVTNLGEMDGQPVMWKLYVHPGAHGRGLGTALLDAVLDAADGSMAVEYLHGNERAARFYRSRDFEEVRRTTIERFPDLKWVWMRKEVSPDA